MLIKIALTVIYAALSLPIFPYFLFYEKLVRESPEDKNNSSSSGNSSGAESIFFMVILCIFSVFISTTFFTSFSEMGIQYSYLFPIIVPVAFQFIWACIFLKKKFLPIILPLLFVVLLISIFIPIRNAVLPYTTPMIEDPTVITETEKPLLERQEIIVRFGATSISDTNYSNGQYIYTLEGGSKGYGLVFANTNSVNFYSCVHKNSISGIVRDSYKTLEIVSLGIVIDNEIPYAKFGVIKRASIFAKPEIDFYLLLNLVKEDVELTPYSNETLPQFACD